MLRMQHQILLFNGIKNEFGRILFFINRGKPTSAPKRVKEEAWGSPARDHLYVESWGGLTDPAVREDPKILLSVR